MVCKSCLSVPAQSFSKVVNPSIFLTENAAAAASKYIPKSVKRSNFSSLLRKSSFSDKNCVAATFCPPCSRANLTTCFAETGNFFFCLTYFLSSSHLCVLAQTCSFIQVYLLSGTLKSLRT